MTQMYSNARLSKPSSPLKAPRSAVDQFEVSTRRPSYTTFSETTLVPRHRQKTKQLFDASMKATLVYPKPEIYQLDPSIVKFSSLQRATSATSTTETPAVPYTPKEHSPHQLGQAGTVVELSKHHPLVQHVGATHHRYPIDVVGDTLLRQQALLTINNLPSIIARLKDDIGELTQARSGMAGMAPSRKKGTPPSVPPSVPPRVGSAAAAGNALDDFDEEELDEETEKEIKDIERIGKEIERVLLRIGTSQDPLADKDLLALKRLGVVDQATLSATQAEAKRIATEATTAIKVRVAGLKGTPPKSGSLGQMKK